MYFLTRLVPNWDLFKLIPLFWLFIELLFIIISLFLHSSFFSLWYKVLKRLFVKFNSLFIISLNSSMIFFSSSYFLFNSSFVLFKFLITSLISFIFSSKFLFISSFSFLISYIFNSPSLNFFSILVSSAFNCLVQKVLHEDTIESTWAFNDLYIFSIFIAYSLKSIEFLSLKELNWDIPYNK